MSGPQTEIEARVLEREALSWSQAVADRWLDGGADWWLAFRWLDRSRAESELARMVGRCGKKEAWSSSKVADPSTAGPSYGSDTGELPICAT